MGRADSKEVGMMIGLIVKMGSRRRAAVPKRHGEMSFRFFGMASSSALNRCVVLRESLFWSCRC